MNIETAFPSAYLKAADLQGKSPQVAIERVEMATFDGEGEKPVVRFVGKAGSGRQSSSARSKCR